MKVDGNSNILESDNKSHQSQSKDNHHVEEKKVDNVSITAASQHSVAPKPQNPLAITSLEVSKWCF